MLRHRPVLLIVIGSDLAMMDALTECGRPLYDRATILRVDLLTPADVAELAELDDATATDGSTFSPSRSRIRPAHSSCPENARWPPSFRLMRLLAAGSIKWREVAPFTPQDLRDLVGTAAPLPGFDAAVLVGVSCVPSRIDGLARLWAPKDLVSVWR